MQASPHLDTIRLIVGMSRSGTTSMVHALNMRGDIAAFGETGFWGLPVAKTRTGLSRKQIEELSDLYKRVHMTTLNKNGAPEVNEQKLADMMARAINALPEGVRPKDVFIEMGEAVARAYKKSFWVEKTPFHLMYIDDILSCYPNCRIIICLRSPESFLLSYKYLGSRKDPIVKQNMESLYHPILASLICRKNIKQAQKASSRYPERVLILHLEETIKSPQETLQRVYDHLKLPESRIKTFPQTNSSFQSDQNKTQKLSDIELFWLNLFISKDSQKVGISLSRPKVNFFRILPSIGTLILWPLRNFKILTTSHISPLRLISRWLK